MSEKIKVVKDDETVVETPAIQIDWKSLGKKVAIYGGVLLTGLAVGYALAQPDDEYVDIDETENDSTETPDEV